MKAIGGYLGLELQPGNEYHAHLTALNTGRNAFEYILRLRGYKKVYLPFFTCDAMMEPIARLGVQVEQYHIDKQLTAIFNKELASDECIVCNNYFGVKDAAVAELAARVPQLIVDNSQAFFTRPPQGVDTFYSCRKFVGVPDGGYASCTVPSTMQLLQDISHERCAHLLKRMDTGAESGYADYTVNEELLAGQEIKEMSHLTRQIMASIDYNRCREIRNANFSFLHQQLGRYNELGLDMATISGPQVYPLLVRNDDFKKRLLMHRIFIATYWPNVLQWCSKDSFEYYLTQNLLPLPIDQRYTEEDMARMIDILLPLLNQ